MRAALLLLVLLSACSGPDRPPVTASDVRVFAPLPGQMMTAGYLNIDNHSNTVVRIDRVTSPQFRNIEIHETTNEGGVSRMRQLDGLSIAPNKRVTLDPGGIHLMLMSPADSLDEVTLHFYSGDLPLLTTTTRIESR